MILDAPARIVANPFLARDGNCLLLFFELMNETTGRGEIGPAESGDGFA